MIKVDLSGAAGFFDPAGPDYAAAAQAHRTLLEHTGAGADFTGWLDLPGRMQNGELKQILAAASRIRGRSQALVVVGIGRIVSRAQRAPWNCCGRIRSPRPENSLCRQFPVPGRADASSRGAGRSGL